MMFLFQPDLKKEQLKQYKRPESPCVQEAAAWPACLCLGRDMSESPHRTTNNCKIIRQEIAKQEIKP